MKKKISVLLMVLVMVLSATVTSYAAVGDGGISTYATTSVSYNINRSSYSTANAEVSVFFSDVVDSYSVVIYLQKNVNGIWTNDTTHDDYVLYNNGINTSIFLREHTYTSLTYGTSYRLMVVSRDIIDGAEIRTTSYSDPF